VVVGLIRLINPAIRRDSIDRARVLSQKLFGEKQQKATQAVSLFRPNRISIDIDKFGREKIMSMSNRKQRKK
jgi:hypothetical protein